MFRWIAILLLALLPLQSAWTAVGSYCEHEQGSDAGHFGHHAHAHKANDHEEPKTPSSKAHPDCAACMLHVKTLAAITLDLLTAPATSPPAAAPHQAVGQTPYARTERPKWAGLAA